MVHLIQCNCCIPAPIGSYISTIGATNPTLCSSGTTTTVVGQSFCIDSQVTAAQISAASTDKAASSGLIGGIIGGVIGCMATIGAAVITIVAKKGNMLFWRITVV